MKEQDKQKMKLVKDMLLRNGYIEAVKTIDDVLKNISEEKEKLHICSYCGKTASPCRCYD